MSSIEKRISTIKILIKFCRNLKTKDDLETAKELLEYAEFFSQEADKLFEAHKKELSVPMQLAKRVNG